MASPASAWVPSRSFDLISCVHGLRYVGDKLAVLARAASWLILGGLLVADLAGIRTAGGRRPSRALRGAGFSSDFRRRRVSRTGRLEAVWPYRYLGAAGRAGPNYTGQPAVTCRYG